MTYKKYVNPLTNRIEIVRDSDNAFLVEHPDSYDFQQYLEWVAEGNEPEEWIPVPVEETPPAEEPVIEDAN